MSAILERANQALNPPTKAREMGHDLYFDSGMSALRWTCRRCGRAALRLGTSERGSALRKACNMEDDDGTS